MVAAMVAGAADATVASPDGKPICPLAMTVPASAAHLSVSCAAALAAESAAAKTTAAILVMDMVPPGINQAASLHDRAGVRPPCFILSGYGRPCKTGGRFSLDPCQTGGGWPFGANLTVTS